MGNNCAGQCAGCYKRDLEIVVNISPYFRKVSNNKFYQRNQLNLLVNGVQKIMFNKIQYSWVARVI